MFGIFNGLILYLTGTMFPNEVVLGNATVSMLAAIVLAALVFTLTVSLLPIVLTQLNVAKLSTNSRYIVYALVNILVVWLLSRMALIFGFGIASKYMAIS